MTAFDNNEALFALGPDDSEEKCFQMFRGGAVEQIHPFMLDMGLAPPEDLPNLSLGDVS